MKSLRGWYLYDWANSAFATIILAALLPVWFAESVVPEGGIHAFGLQWSATSLWGYTSGLSALLVFCTAPFLGAMADLGNRRRRWLIAFFLPGSLATVGLFTALPGRVAWTLALYMIASLGFVAANIFYDSFLPLVADPRNRDRVSSRGYAWGYLGGGLAFLIALLLVSFHESIGLEKGLAVRISLALAGFWWGGFGLLAWKWMEEPAGEKPAGSIAKSALRRTFSTFRTVSSRRALGLFLLAFLFYNDGVQTVVKMASIYGKEELGLATGDLMGTLLLVQLLGIPGALLFALFAGVIGARKAILFSLVLWTVVILWAWRMESAREFWILGAMVGLCLGGTQALSRSLFSRFIPEGKSAEYFGFYSVFAKFSAVAGPILFALIRQLTGSSRQSILALLVFFILGFFLLLASGEERDHA
ncbi:MAG: MFS transporter [Candidatus Krumholzibacteria bacterium]|jgi:UMF1 family MFS transporter|nr:MFS transporter [Candidatus Krumholzibacteria bacterium]MDP6797371.1 MFS transporter [Candidatus Krumholzibacteria bacterium]MDP7021570.1 MFS transporter [Candidatus Krumholzibacteria bacterium]